MAQGFPGNRLFRSGFPFRLVAAVALILVRGGASAQDPFPAGEEGVLYYCPRIDLNPAKEGGPLTIELDGILDEAAWQRAAFQHWSNPAGNPRDSDPVEEDLDLAWAVVADENFLYVAWKVVDDARTIGESFFCNVWQDDSVEVYLDALNNGPVCPGAASCYGTDDAQITVGADQVGKYDPIDPDLLEFGGVAGKGACDFGAAAPELCRGVAADLDSEEGFTGWQGEIAIALDTLGNADDGTPEWHIVPSHGTTIGFSMHVNDDDNGADRDHKLIWAKHEVAETAWQNPGAFGKLIFVAPAKPLAVVSRDIPDDLQNGGSGTVTLSVSPKLGAGEVTITEDLPAGLTPSSPTGGGVLAGQKITWNLGRVDAPASVAYTLTVSADVVDTPLGGTAAIDGEAVAISGDTVYSGSPISAEGFIKLWSHLGPLAGGSCGPGPDMALDWILNKDGSLGESTISPFPGMVTRPAYGGTGIAPDGGARSTGLQVFNGAFVDTVTDQFPVWKAATAVTDSVDHAAPQIHGFDANDHVTLSSVYVTNKTGGPLETQLGMGSDDSIQVLLDGVSIWENNVACRPWGNPGEEQDVSPPFTLPVGESRVLVKIADGTGGSGFRLRFRKVVDDPSAGGLLPPDISLSLVSTLEPPPASVVRSLAKDTYSLGETVLVSLSITAQSPPQLILREVLPAGATAADISDGGVQTGGVIEWNLSNVAQKTVTYQLKGDSCSGDLAYGQSTAQAGSVEAVVTGASSLRRLFTDEPLGTWNSRDIEPAGDPGSGVAQRIDDGSVVVSGDGNGIKGSADSFRFISIAATDDFDLKARIDCFDNPGGAGQAGLMVRDTDDPFSAHALFYMGQPTSAGAGSVGKLRGVYRRETAAGRSSSVIVISAANADVPQLPIHLRLRRAGNKLTFERSSDGIVFTEVGKLDVGTMTGQVNLKSAVNIGLATSGGGGGTMRATYSGLSGFSTVEGPTFRRGDVDANGLIDISDAVGLLGSLFLGGGTPACLEAGDTDNNGEVDITDAVNNLGYQFLGGVAPADPGPRDCGKDPQAPTLSCDKACP